MNSKIVNLYLPPRNKKINLYVSGASKSYVFSGSYVGDVPINYLYMRVPFDETPLDGDILYEKANPLNYVENYSFELGTNYDFTDWTKSGENTWNRVALSTGNTVHSGTYSAKVALDPTKSVATITSASFSVNEGELYQASGYFFAQNGKTKTEGSSDATGARTITYGSLIPYYVGKIEWYTSAHELVETSYFASDSDETVEMQSSDPDSEIETGYDIDEIVLSNGTILYGSDDGTNGTSSTGTLQTDGTYKSRPFWKYFKANFRAPLTSACASIIIEGYPDSLSAGETPVYFPKVFADDVRVIVPTSRMEIFFTTPFSGSTFFTAEFDDSSTEEGANTLTFSASSAGGSYDDCTGKLNYFSTSTEDLVIGKVNDVANKSWMPFKIDFGSQDKAIKIYSVYLNVISSEDKKVALNGADCHVQVGFDSNGSNVTMPTTWTELNGKTLTANPYSGSIAEDWEAGTGYLFNITRSAKKIFGTYGITWTNDSMSAVLAKTLDSNTNTNQWRKFASIEHSSYTPPQLKFTYADMNYSACAVDTWISMRKGEALSLEDSQTASITNHYEDTLPFIHVGHSTGNTTLQQIRRGLIYFDLNFIGGSPAITDVTNAHMFLYLQNLDASVATTRDVQINCHKMLSPWDASTATWVKMHGMRDWSGSPGGFHGDDCDTGTVSGSISITITAGATAPTREWKDFKIPNALVKEWITSGSLNYGLMIKREVEDYNGTPDCHGFVSSQDYVRQSYHPYLEIDYIDNKGANKNVIVKSNATELG